MNSLCRKQERYFLLVWRRHGYFPPRLYGMGVISEEDISIASDLLSPRDWQSSHVCLYDIVSTI